ncbi:hypothetical protein ABFX02_08G137400 [Erythranthe guttata]
MAGNVYLKTNRFEVKLEGITFKTKDFEYLCEIDFLFPEGRVWDHPPIVGLDVMRHPRDPSILLILLSFGVGCVILRFVAGEPLPLPIHKFLSDKRIRFVGFGIPEKKKLFPFKELGLSKTKVDIGYLAANILKEPKCKTWELAELARRVLGIKRMIGMTEASSFERHEQIKCAICQLFITSVIAMGLSKASEKKKSSFLKNLNSLHILAEGWFFKLPKGKKKNQTVQVEEEGDSVHVHIGEMEDMLGDDFLVRMSPFGDSKNQESDDTEEYSSSSKVEQDSSGEDFSDDKDTSDDGEKNESCSGKLPLKGILKCPSTNNMFPSEPVSPSAENDQNGMKGALKRANSKGCNVRFKCQ